MIELTSYHDGEWIKFEPTFKGPSAEPPTAHYKIIGKQVTCRFSFPRRKNALIFKIPTKSYSRMYTHPYGGTIWFSTFKKAGGEGRHYKFYRRKLQNKCRVKG